MKITRILVANRGEIADRVIRTAKRLGIATVAVYSEPDSGLPFVTNADEAVELTAEAPRAAYLDADQILHIAERLSCDAVHPGYGFLSENPQFAAAVQSAGMRWIGPDPSAMLAMSDKIASRNAVGALGVPVAAGTSQPVTSVDEAVARAAELGYPLMVKPSAGGGGIGMFAVHDDVQLTAGFASSASRAAAAFGSSEVLLERLIAAPRHVEIQVLGGPDGRSIALGERDCSVQRRHQKLLEESPSPIVDEELRRRMSEAAVVVADSVAYQGAGTVEFLVNAETSEFVFLEMNTRLQVEHGVTEMRLGIDLVEQQLRVASGLPIDLTPSGEQFNHVIELRVNAEDPKRFFPSPGRIEGWVQPQGQGIRVDAGYGDATTVSAHYDSLVAKLLVGGVSRGDAIARALDAVRSFEIVGLKTNLPFFEQLLADPEFNNGRFDTGIVSEVIAKRAMAK